MIASGRPTDEDEDRLRYRMIRDILLSSSEVTVVTHRGFDEEHDEPQEDILHACFSTIIDHEPTKLFTCVLLTEERAAQFIKNQLVWPDMAIMESPTREGIQAAMKEWCELWYPDVEPPHFTIVPWKAD